MSKEGIVKTALMGLHHGAYQLINSTVGALASISEPHSKIHEGVHYSLVEERSLALNDVVDYLIITPTQSPVLHLINKVSSEGAKYTVYEGTTVSANGTDLTSEVFNHNRNSVNVTSAQVFLNPSVITTGAALATETIINPNKTSSIITQDRKEDELILKINTMYLFRFVANKAGITGVHFDFYEIENHDF